MTESKLAGVSAGRGSTNGRWRKAVAMLRVGSEIEVRAYSEWQGDGCPASCLPLYRRKAEATLLSTRHLAKASPDAGISVHPGFEFVASVMSQGDLFQ